MLLFFTSVILTAQDKNMQNLNGRWKFTYDDKNIGIQKEYYRIDPDDTDWKTVEIPTFWGDAEYDGIGWYARNFVPDEKFQGKKVAIFFECVDDDADVYLNGEKIIVHKGYNVRFNKDITGKLKFGQKNSLVVKITDGGGAGGLCGEVCLREFKDSQDLMKSKYFSRESTPLPGWAENTLIYELYVRAHSQKGDFISVIDDLPRLKELGVGCIWFMPVFPIGEVKRKGSAGSPYAIKDFMEVNPEYGTKADFQQLIDAAHDYDIRVIIDIACNHSAWDNWLLKEHPEYYNRNDNGEIIHPAGTDWTDVADFNYENDDLREYMWNVLEYWVRDLNIDGYRCDVAELVPDDFWAEAYKRLSAIKPDILMLAEGAHPRLHINGFNLTYAWNFRMTIAKILEGKQKPAYLAEVMEKDYFRYPKNTRHMIFTENHDKQRTVEFFGDDKALLAAVLNLSLPGIPMIYDGQEVGAEHTPSLFEKEPINWDFDNHYYKFYNQYFQIRKNNPAFAKGKFQITNTNQPDKVLAYSRISENNRILIIGNISGEKVVVSTELEINNFEHLMGGIPVLDNGSLRLELPAYGFSVIDVQ